MSDFQLDKVDIDILRELQRDSRLSVRELAARVHRSATPVFERLRRLESEGVILRSFTLQNTMKSRPTFSKSIFKV